MPLMCKRCAHDPVEHFNGLCGPCWNVNNEQQTKQEQAEETDAEGCRLGEETPTSTDTRDLLATEGWFLPNGDSGAPVMRPTGRTVVTVPQLQPGRETPEHGVRQPSETIGHRSPEGGRMRRDEHTPVYMCKICGQPKVTHLLGYQHEFVPEVFVDPVLTKISLDCMTMNLDPPPTDWDLRHLKHAEQVADSSKDPSTKVGSVIIDAKRRVLGVGYNGFPRGILDSPERLGDRDVKYSLMVHAELNAILNSGDVTRLEGATLYSSLFPCNECAKSIIQVGITRVVTRISSIDRWRESNGAAAKMFREAGVEVVER